MRQQKGLGKGVDRKTQKLRLRLGVELEGI